MYSVGLMSGTSMDGIDAALLETDGSPNHLRTIAFINVPYQKEFILLLKAAEYTVRFFGGDLILAEKNFVACINDYLTQQLQLPASQKAQWFQKMLVYLDSAHDHSHGLYWKSLVKRSTVLHAQAVNQLLKKVNIQPQDIDVIGYHGQTMLHKPQSSLSINLGDGQLLAQHLGITVVNDFRQQDILAGGQGAPFAPLYHQALAVRDHRIPAIVVNCGGISNITIINSSHAKDLMGFDCGPGNALLDSFVRRRTQGKFIIDQDGCFSAKGKVKKAVLAALYQHAVRQEQQNYFHAHPPKSLDYGDLHLIPELDELTLADGCRTLAAFSADSIIQSVDRFATVCPSFWVLAGGGWQNPTLLDEFKSRIAQKYPNHVKVHHADEIGWSSQSLEAEMFAYYAVRSLRQLPLSFPGTTGVKQPTNGGCIHVV